MLRGEWRDPAKLERAAVQGFTGMLLIPVTLTVAFIVPALMR